MDSFFIGAGTKQDLKGSVVNGAPVEPQSRTLSEPAGESKSCFPHQQKTESIRSLFFVTCNGTALEGHGSE